MSLVQNTHSDRALVEFLHKQNQQNSLRFITCGSVDDGKSTLIGRLLFETQSIFDDQLQSVESDSKHYGTQSGAVDLALLVDGLQAEREQGITIDVAYRFFATEHRRYIVADTPGHEQYTRNMATGASTADLAVILVDARKGVLTQTKRHSRIVALMGIEHLVLAVNKMDLVDYSQVVFDDIVLAYQAFAGEFNFKSIQAIPVSGLTGDNVALISDKMPWFDGPCLMDYLDHVCIHSTDTLRPFRMPVQTVLRPNLDFRGYSGRLAQGALKVGESVKVLPSGVESRVKQIFNGFEVVEQAANRSSITLTLEDEIDISRGDVLVAPQASPEVADQFEVTLIWLADTPLMSGRSYLLKLGTQEVSASVMKIKHKIEVNSGQALAADVLTINDIARVTLSTASPIVFEPYEQSRQLGGFILIDKRSWQTLGAGRIEFALRRANNIHWQNLTINQTLRANQKNQTARCIWFTGLSGSGKSTLANALEQALFAEGQHCYVLDGDNVRHGLNRDLGFSEADRVENIRRVAEVAKLMVDAGLVVLVSFISPFAAERQMARNLFADGEFVEVFVDTPLAVCEQRDVKGLYAKARAGHLANFTGIDSPYEPPKKAEMTIQTNHQTVAATVQQMMKWLTQA